MNTTQAQTITVSAVGCSPREQMIGDPAEESLFAVRQLSAGQHNLRLLTVPVQRPELRAREQDINPAPLMRIETARGVGVRVLTRAAKDRREEVLAYLRSQPDWPTAKDVAAALGYSTGYASMLLLDLLRGGEVERGVISEYPIAHGYRAARKG